MATIRKKLFHKYPDTIFDILFKHSLWHSCDTIHLKS